jgi:hypothetical protein
MAAGCAMRWRDGGQRRDRGGGISAAGLAAAKARDGKRRLGDQAGRLVVMPVRRVLGDENSHGSPAPVAGSDLSAKAGSRPFAGMTRIRFKVRRRAISAPQGTSTGIPRPGSPGDKPCRATDCRNGAFGQRRLKIWRAAKPSGRPLQCGRVADGIKPIPVRSESTGCSTNNKHAVAD